MSEGIHDRMDSSQTLGIRFTGSGSEYFRIWIVNLLMLLFGVSYWAMSNFAPAFAWLPRVPCLPPTRA